MTKLIVGKEYILNEDIKDFIYLTQESEKNKLEPIKAGTMCKLVRVDGDYITIEVNGRRINTESHMLDY